MEDQMLPTMPRCLEAHSFTLSTDHSPTESGSLRNIPSPEQGTSVSTISKKPVIFEKAVASLCVVTTLGSPHLIRFSARILARNRFNSLATNKLSSGRQDASSVDFPPGAAHKSNTFKGCDPMISTT